MLSDISVPLLLTFLSLIPIYLREVFFKLENGERMLYRKFPRCRHDISILGFGCMRLPPAEGQQAGGKVDEQKATALIRTAIDGGVNYIDTAYPYHNGESELVVGRALGDGYRDRVFLATKLPSWLVTSREEMDRYLDEQLARLATDHIDFYLLHGLGGETWENLSRLGVLEFLDSARADGRIRYPAFSFHDQFPVFKEIVDAYEWTFAQIQYNYMDEQYQAGTQGLKYAAEQGLGIVVMEPLRGGLLSGDVPAIHQHIRNAPVRRTPSEWGLRWVWNHPEVTVVLSGMTAMEQVRENLACAEQGLPDSLSPGRACRCRNDAGHVCLPREDPVHRLPLLHAVRTRRRYPLVLHVLQPGVHLRCTGESDRRVPLGPQRFVFRGNTGVCLLLCPVRGVRGEMPAAFSHPGIPAGRW